jgi:hypothetical protein
MNEHLTLDELGDLVDGSLSAPDAQRAARHLDGCERCRSEMSRLRGVIAAAAALPKTVEPPPELWRTIREDLEARKVAHLHVPRPVPAWRWNPARAWLIAASIVVVTTTVLLARSSARKPMNVGSGLGPPASTVERIELRYMPTLTQLSASLRERSASVPRKTIATVNQSLEIVDSAIAETRAALIQDPENRGIAELLSANYQRKMDLLKRASELASEF